MAKSNEVYINKSIHDALTKLAEKNGVTRAVMLNRLLTEIGLINKEIKSITLQIPTEYLTSKALLITWLEHKNKSIVDLFYPEQKK